MEAPSNQAPTISRSHHLSNSNHNSTNNGAEQLLSQFAQRLGTSSNQSSNSLDASHGSSTMDRSKSLLALFWNGVSDDDVVLVLPSLAMRMSDSNTALPDIGETQKGNVITSTNNSTFPTVQSTSSRPHMAASVLTAASDDAATVEQKAATSVSKQTSWTRSTVMYASNAVVSNASDFFTKLTDSRLRSWTLLLLRHSLSTGNPESRSRLLNMLSATVKVEKTETSFKTLPLPDSAKGQPMDADVILPLLMEVILHISIQDKKEIITVRAPGTISGFLQNGLALKKVVIRLDTGVLLSSMVDQARLVVFKAVANATKAPIPTPKSADDTAATIKSTKTSIDDKKVGSPSENTATAKGASSTNSVSSTSPSSASALAPSTRVSNLSGFQSALNLSVAPSADLPPNLQKARSSALKLSSVLYGGSARSTSTGDSGASNGASALGPRRNRSIKWDHPWQLPKIGTAGGGGDTAPDAKKVRMAETAAKLKSFKSFGRPHAGVFGSGPRNATFGEYNRAHLWGRDGRLAHHPVPMQMGSAQNPLDMGPVAADKNATFDFSPSSLLSRKSPGSMAPPVPSASGGASIPRSATILEKMLMKSSTSGQGF